MEYVVDLKKRKSLFKKRLRIRNKWIKLSEKFPSFFVKRKRPQLVKDEVLKSFPSKYYGQLIEDKFFEGWDLRSLLENAMHIGYELGRNKSKVFKNREESKVIYNLENKFDIVFQKGKREYDGTRILKFTKINENSCTIEYMVEYDETKVYTLNVPFEKAVQIYQRWVTVVSKI